MKRSLMSFIVIFIMSYFSAGCMGLMGYHRYNCKNGKILTNNGFQIIIDDVKSGGLSTNYFMDIKIRNVGNSKRFFDSGELELVNSKSGLTFYSVSKDKSSISVPVGMANLITKTAINPGRMIAGMLWFTTPAHKADARELTMYYGEKSINLHRR